MQLTSVARARNVICGTVGTLPLRCYRTMAGLTEEVDPPSWADNPDPRYTRLWTFASTIDDLLFHGRAYWRVASRTALGFPASFEYVTLPRVGFRQTRGAITDRYAHPPELAGRWVLTIDGAEQADRDVVRFDGMGSEGILIWGARELRTALALSARGASLRVGGAARHRAEGPGPGDGRRRDRRPAFEVGGGPAGAHHRLPGRGVRHRGRVRP